MYTDMVGYTALGQRNESLSLALVEEQRKLIRPILTRHNGREIKTMGDAFLVEFHNALDSVRCAYDIQRATREFNISLPAEKRVHLRVGLHLGDVVESRGDISGDAVNVASRIEPLAEDGGVCLTRQLYDHVSNKFELQMSSFGLKSLKNVTEPIEIFKVVMPWEPTTSAERTAYPSNRIAILPFVSMSTSPDDAFFADGVTEEIISTVSGISGLNVISRTSVMHYKKTEKTLREIGKELEVGSVLEGSFRKAGNKIRVTAQLIDVAGDRHLWAQNYDRNLDDVFEVQSDVAKQVADALKIRILSPEKERIEKKPTESTAAYTLYLKGRQLWNKRELSDVKEALTYFERAVEKDQTFALGYVGQADCYSVVPLVPETEGIRRTKELVSKALELDPDLAEAHTTNGLVLACEYDFHHAEEEFQKALELKPSYATAHQWYFLQVLAPELRWGEGLGHIERALELDPLSPILHLNLGLYHFWRRDWNMAIDPFRRAIELGLKTAHLNLAENYGFAKRPEDMKREFAAWAEAEQGVYPALKMVADVELAYFEGDKQAALRLTSELEAHSQDPGMYWFWIAESYFALGDIDKGFEWLERAYSKRESAVLMMAADPILDGVRTDPRYLDLLKRLGLDQTA
jgi:TolB-like protein/lipoprotein NlpI